MHSLLEDYLLEVDVYLESMPFKRRNEELCEMLVHLENAVIVSRELGQTENEAVQSAVAQFGTPQDLGESVVRAWQREQTLNRRSLWGAAICSLTLLLFVPVLVIPLERPYFDPANLMHLSREEWLCWLLGYRFIGPILAGVLTSLVFSKRAVLGGVYGPALYFILCIPASFAHLGDVASLCVQDSLVILLVAWISRRAQIVWSKRKGLKQV